MSGGRPNDGQPASVDDLDPAVRAVVRELADRVVSEGARAVVVTGSQVGPSRRPESDIDLYVIGDGPRYRLELVVNHLASLSWRNPTELRASFDDPGAVGALVPGWRHAVIVADPDGIAADLQRVALEWDWSVIGDARLDAWVGEEITGYAEEVHKLVAARRGGDFATAAVQRSVLALALAPRLTVHLRMLYATENGLWDRVADLLGAEWAAAQRAALGLSGEGLARSLDAAVELFRLAVDATWPVMNERQQAVCAGALALAGRPAPG